MSNSLSNAELPKVGILGDGQLAMMMAEAYRVLGGSVCILGQSADGPASAVAEQVFVGTLEDQAVVAEFFAAVDVVTLENEFNDGALLVSLSEKFQTPIYPDPAGFEKIGDKLSEKQFFQAHGVSLANFFEVSSEADLSDAPGYLKLAKGGYDGIGTYRVENKAEAIEVFNTIKSAGTVLFEEMVDFKQELSLVAVSDGQQVVFYPLVETLQESGTCRYVRYPAGVDAAVEAEAQAQVGRIMRGMNTKGLFAFEYFLTHDDQLVLNESAPRPHNSGHITLDSADCSQFENHMRAVAGLELKQPVMQHESMTMVNLLGTRDGESNEQMVLAQVDDSQASLKMYRKKQSRIKRKMGHINLWGSNQKQRAEQFVRDLEI